MRTSYRDTLPQRRRCETFNMRFGNQRTLFTVTMGYYDNAITGEPDVIGEVFVDGAKIGSEMSAITRDSAVLLSLALQHGVPIATIKGALTRNERGNPATVIGAIVDGISRP